MGIRLNLRSLYTGSLNTFDALFGSPTGEVRVTPETFPVPTTGGYTTQIGHWAKSDVDTFAFELLSHGIATLVHEVLVKSVMSDWCMDT